MNTLNARSSSPQAAGRPDDHPALLPWVDVLEDAEAITLYADLPGVKREQLQLQVEGDELSIEATMTLPAADGLKPLHVEVHRQTYRRRFALSKELDAQRVSAELTQGILRVRVPKAAHAQTRRVPVQVG